MSLHAKDSKRYRIQSLCRLFGVSKQAYYKVDENKALAKAARESFAVDFVRSVRKDDRGIGGQLLYVMYKKEMELTGDAIGRDAFYRLMYENGLKVKQKQRRPRTTDSTHGLPTFPDIVKNFIPKAPNQLWVSDITYIKLWLSKNIYEFCFLSLVLDAYTKEIVGWSVKPTLSKEGPLEAIEMALKRIDGLKKEDIQLIHHSDRGIQYASKEYISKLQSYNIRISMTETGNPKDNAQAERINNTIKNELLKGIVFQCIDEVVDAVGSAVNFYNNRRPHMSINYKTPVEASQCTGEIRKRWHSFREAAIKREKQKNLVEPADTQNICLPLDSYPESLTVNP